MTFEVEVSKQVENGDEFGNIEWTVTAESRVGEHRVSRTHKDVGKAFKSVLAELTFEVADGE